MIGGRIGTRSESLLDVQFSVTYYLDGNMLDDIDNIWTLCCRNDLIALMAQ